MFWRVRSNGQWGAYGTMLVSGYFIWVPHNDTSVYRRVGPFAPPIAIPPCSGEMLLSTAGRSEFENSFRDYQFEEVTFDKTPWVPWHEWSTPMCKGVPFPDEQMLHDEPHSDEARIALGTYWRVALGIGIQSDFLPGPNAWSDRLIVNASTWNGRDIIQTRPRRVEILLVSDKMRSWLEARWERWVEFESVQVAA